MRHIMVSLSRLSVKPAIKNSGAAAAVATGELPSVIKPPQVQPGAPVFFLFSSFSNCSFPNINTLLSIFNPLPLPWSLLLSKCATSEPYSLYSPLSSKLISISFFPSLLSVFLTNLVFYFMSS